MNVDTNGFNVNTIGWVLLVVGIVRVILSMIFWSIWAGGYWSRRRPVDGGPAPH